MPHPEAPLSSSTSTEVSMPRISSFSVLNPDRPVWKSSQFWAFIVWPFALVALCLTPLTTDSGKIGSLSMSLVASTVVLTMLSRAVRRELRGIASKSGVYTFACFGEFGQDRVHVEVNHYEASKRMLALSPDQILSFAFEEIVKTIEGVPEGVDLRKCEYVRVPSAEYGFDPSNTTCIRANFRVFAEDERTFYFFVVLSKSVSEICHLVHLNGRLTGRLDERLTKAREV